MFLDKLSQQEKDEILTSISGANYSWILYSMILGTLSHISRAMRWRQLMSAIGYHARGLSTFFAVMIMYFANLAVPRLGEVSRCAILKQYDNIPVEKSFGTVVAERAIDLVMLGITFALTCLLQYDKILEAFAALEILKGDETVESSYLKYIILGSGLFVLALLFILRKHPVITKVYNKVKELILGFVDGLKSAFKVKNPLLFIGHSIFIWVMYFAMVWISFPAMEELSGLGFLAGLSCLVFGSVGIVLVPGGIGLYPLIIAKILVLYGIQETSGYAFGWVLWIGQTALLVVWGILSLTLLPVLVKKVDKNDSTEQLQTS